MKYLVTFILAACFANLSLAQMQNQYGEKFTFDVKNEKDAHFVLQDNYNTYLLTNLNVDGIGAGHQMIVRKFDQKNTLVETFTFDYPKIEPLGTLYDYLGYAESAATGKVAVFAEAHSGNAAKSIIYKFEFNKATSKFTSTVLAENSIASLMKAGNAYAERSLNGKYIAVNYHNYRDKAAPDKNLLIVIDANTLNVAWQKELTFNDEFTSQNYTVTNSGKVVMMRDMKGSKKGITYLSIISADKQEDQHFEAQVFLNSMKAISIGADEYLVAFNSDNKNFREDYYNNLMLYDLKSGKILNNTKTRDFASVKQLTDVDIRDIVLQNNEIHVFADAKAPAPQTGNGFSNMSSFDVAYNWGPGYLYVLSFDGQLKATKKLYTDGKAAGESYHSFGVLNIKGNYYINAGGNGVYQLTKTFDRGESVIYFYPGDPYGNTSNRFINQLVAYFPDKGSLLFGRTINNNEMSLVSVTGVK
ncbi:hypothetical protein ACFQZS_16000 [Mucilaginibacter calamicampi]|uniref:Uncharacterized protein n=1 Tax=Mucilaginibacter calamicampi TaxID=1302352 RepID=A0ABW2YZJ9_9SPHI